MEYCATVASIKYLFLYQMKGEDLVTVSGANENDEISMYLTKRYVSSCSAFWRIAEYPVVEISPSVQELKLHLEDEQSVTYEATREGTRRALTAASETQLTAYFEMNSDPIHGALARDTKYKVFLTNFIW